MASNTNIENFYLLKVCSSNGDRYRVYTVRADREAAQRKMSTVCGSKALDIAMTPVRAERAAILESIANGDAESAAATVHAFVPSQTGQK